MRHAGEIVAHLLHQLHAEFLVRHFAAAKLELHAHFVAALKKFFAVPNFRKVIVIIDVHPELDLFQFRAGRFLVLFLLRYVITKLSERDNFADRRCRRG